MIVGRCATESEKPSGHHLKNKLDARVKPFQSFFQEHVSKTPTVDVLSSLGYSTVTCSPDMCVAEWFYVSIQLQFLF